MLHICTSLHGPSMNIFQCFHVICVYFNCYWLGFPGTSNWEETPGKTQDTLEGFYLPAGLWTPQDPPEWAGKCCRWEGSLGQPAGSTAPATRPRNKRMRMDGWMEQPFAMFRQVGVMYIEPKIKSLSRCACCNLKLLCALFIDPGRQAMLSVQVNTLLAALAVIGRRRRRHVESRVEGIDMLWISYSAP